MFRYIFSLVFIVLVVGCTYIVKPQNEQNKLYNMLLSLDKNVSKIEAKRLSKEIVFFSRKLKQQYQPLIEPHFNNFLVNVGLKKQGLCYEWSDALYIHFVNQSYKDFRFHLIVSNKGEYWSEHNAFAITNSKDNISEGIIIDLWRDIDGMYINYIIKDKSYQWSLRKNREYGI